jgi:energy-coupling factor transporter ATP-binding protein EcfA2
MQQRLALAQALIMRPRILLLDEPFDALDPGVRLDMHELLTDLWREHNLTILMVTHDIKEAFRLGTRVIAFDKRRHDPQAPNRYGSTVVHDYPLDAKKRRAVPKALTTMTERSDCARQLFGLDRFDEVNLESGILLWLDLFDHHPITAIVFGAVEQTISLLQQPRSIVRARGIPHQHAAAADRHDSDRLCHGVGNGQRHDIAPHLFERARDIRRRG